MTEPLAWLDTLPPQEREAYIEAYASYWAQIEEAWERRYRELESDLSEVDIGWERHAVVCQWIEENPEKRLPDPAHGPRP